MWSCSRHTQIFRRNFIFMFFFYNRARILVDSSSFKEGGGQRKKSRIIITGRIVYREVIIQFSKSESLQSDYIFSSRLRGTRYFTLNFSLIPSEEKNFQLDILFYTTNVFRNNCT